MNKIQGLGLLAGKVVIVTGGASGIGRAIAVGAAKYGARIVVVADVRPDPVEGGISAVEEIESFGATGLFKKTNVASREEVEALLEVAREVGGVDVMVCNAGIASPSDGVDMPEAEYRRVTSVNLDGVYFSAQAAGKQMVAMNKTGSIIMTSSMGGLRGSALTVVYSATKGAVCLLAKSLADSYGPKGIRVNAICPGVIDTHLVRSSPAVGAIAEQFVARTPLRRLGRPSEIADVVAWLGSDLSSFVTGANILIDGGLSSVV